MNSENSLGAWNVNSCTSDEITSPVQLQSCEMNLDLETQLNHAWISGPGGFKPLSLWFSIKCRKQVLKKDLVMGLIISVISKQLNEYELQTHLDYLPPPRCDVKVIFSAMTASQEMLL